MRWIIGVQVVALGGIVVTHRLTGAQRYAYALESVIGVLCYGLLPFGLLVIMASVFGRSRAPGCFTIQVLLFISWMIVALPVFQ